MIDIKSDNLQYNTLAGWVDGTEDSSTNNTSDALSMSLSSQRPSVLY